MLEWLEHIDRIIFLKVNGLHSAFLDAVIPALTWFPTWIPLFLVALYFLYRRYKNRVWIILVSAALMILCADQSANLFKNTLVKRYRPTHNLQIRGQVHVVDNYRGGQYGFVSGHAANSFALAVFLVFLFRDQKWKLKIWFIVWALLVCYTRIYLGVHYPLDIIGGALLGTLWAFVFYHFFVWADKKIYPKKT
jgi:undecaprenyl-diphosphatase